MKKANRKTQNLNAQLLYSHRRIIAVWALAAVLLGFFVVLAFPATSEAAVIRRAPNNLGLVGYWSFDDARGSTATDFSGNGNAGTLTNMDTSSDWVAGKRGGALEFDGSDDHVRTDYNGLGEAGQSFTVSIWIKSSDTLSGNNFAINNYVDSDHTGFFAIGSDNNAKGMFLWLRDDNNTEVAKTNYYEPAFDGEWHHYTGVRDIENDEVRFYIDGELKETVNSSNTNPVRDNDSFLGFMRHNDKNSQTLEGKIDEVRVYDRVLSSSEVKGLYNAGGYAKRNATDSTLFPDKLIGHWPMDGPDISGSTVKDVHGSSDGTKNGDPIGRLGVLGQAISFDGDGDWIDVPNGSAAKDVINNGTDFTVSVWGRIDDLESDNSLVMTDQKGSGAQFILWRDESGSGFGRTNTVSVFANGSGGSARVEGASSTWNDRTWKHITATYDSQGKLRLYVNGKEDPNSPADNVGALNSNSNPIRFGADTNGDFQANGETDDIRIYNEALNDNEVSRLYNATKPDTINSSQNEKLTDGLVGMWSFDGQDLTSATATDVSSNSNDGTLKDDPQPAIGRIGQALEFDGTDDLVDLGDPAILKPTGQLSIAAWLRMEDEPAGSADRHPVTAGNITDGGYKLRMFYTDLQFKVQDTKAEKSSFFSGKEGEWQFVVGTWDGATIRLYGNGQQVATTPYTGSISYSGGSGVAVGAHKDSGPQKHWHGGIDNVRIYDRALSRNEIERLYSLGR